MTSVARRREHDDSGEYSDASQDIEHNNSGNDGGQPESDYDSQGSESDNSELQDSENKETERRVDDDEDRSNPQYIPKRGTFYEHDDRTAASGEESTNTASETASEKKEGSETPSERRRPPRKSDIVNKWSHDKYNENEQVPKSREELVAIYGYDIRNEDAPPHARRNRRYGRGPNKYTRTWEDEEAYRRQSAAQAVPRKPPTAEDFPELDAAVRTRGKPRTPRPRSKSQPPSNESLENGDSLRRNASIKSARKPTVKPTPTPRINVAKPQPAKPQKDKMPPLENLSITANLNNSNQGQTPRRVNATVAQQRPVPTEQAKRKPLNQAQPQQQPNPTPLNKTPAQHQPAPQPQQQKPQQQQNQQQQPATGGGSKRYSSLRQRPLAEPYSPQQQQQQPQQPRQQQPPPQQQQQPPQQPQQQQQQHRYHAAPGEFVPTTAPLQPNTATLPHPQHIMHQQVRVSAVSAPAHGASPPHQQQQHTQQVRLGLLEQPQQQLVPHPHHTLHNMPQPHALGQLQPSQGYAPPAMMPAQYMQQSGSGAVFGGAMLCAPHAPLAPHAPPYSHPAQIYPAPHHNYATQAGGVTYYSCAEQEQTPRTQRRPTAAIPIVRPHVNERQVNPTDKDNIDRIVENMFVRKPWPATHGADSKDKPETRNSQEPQSKESSQPNSLTSSSISTDSKPSDSREEKSEEKPEEEKQKEAPEESPATQESITTDA